MKQLNSLVDIYQQLLHKIHFMSTENNKCVFNLLIAFS